MKLRNVLILLLVFVALCAYVYLVEIKQKGEEQARKEKAEKIVNLAKEEIDAIELNSKEHGAIELKKIEGKWVLIRPVKTKADEFAVDTLLHSITARRREKLVKEKDVNWSEYGFDAPSLTLTLVTKRGKTVVKFGDANPAKTSRYVRVDEDPKLVLVEDTLKNAVNKSAHDLRDKTIVAMAPADIDRIVISDKDKELELHREEADDWRMTKPVRTRVKKMMVAFTLRGLTNLQAKKIIDAPEKEGDVYGLEKPELTVLLAGKKLEQVLLIGAPVEKPKEGSPLSPDRYARIKGREIVYVIDGRVHKSLQVDPESLRDRSLFSFQPNNIEKLEIQLDGTTWLAQRDKQGQWVLEKPEKVDQMDAQTVTGILSRLRDMQWMSLEKPSGDDLAPFHLDKPRLVVSLFEKDKTDPMVLKAGWKDKPEEQSPPTAQPEAAGPVEGAPPAAEKKEGGQGAPEVPKVETVNVIVEPHDEKGVVFKVDERLIELLKEDLESLTDKGK